MKFLTSILILMIFISCIDKNKKNTSIGVSDSEITNSNSLKKNNLKEIISKQVSLSLPINDSIGFNSKNNTKKLQKSTWEKFGFEKIENFNLNFDYYIVAKIKLNGELLLLIKRNYTEENIHWLTVLSPKNKLISFIQTAYDNSEGFLTIKSEISENIILIKKWNDFSEENYLEERFIIDNNDFVKQ